MPRFGNRVFAPGLTPTLITVVVMAGLVSLGFWQLRRADEKRDLLATFAAGQTTTVALTAVNAAELPRYQRVTAAGRFDPARQILLDNMPSSTGSAGYHVLTPLVLEDGGLLLVDRGWIPVGRDRATLPDIAVSGEQRQVAGLLDALPQPGMRLGHPDVSQASWPRVLNFPEHADLAAVYGEHLQRPILLLDPGAEGGFERVWEARFGFGPERHIGYAIQWFALSLALVAIYFVVNLRRPAVASI